MAEKRTVYHPKFHNVTREVPGEQEKEWKAAGWRFTPPREPAREAATEPAKPGDSN